MVSAFIRARLNTSAWPREVPRRPCFTTWGPGVLTDGTPSEKQFMDVILVNGRAHQGGKREAAHE